MGARRGRGTTSRDMGSGAAAPSLVVRRSTVSRWRSVGRRGRVAVSARYIKAEKRREKRDRRVAMAHRYGREIQVVRGAAATGQPSAFAWQGAIYRVEEVLATWHLRDRWWQT